MRNIFIVNATQVVVSENHPEGTYSVISEFPKTFDSKNYNDNVETALIVAQAEFADEVKALTIANNPNRVMWTVTLTQVDGKQIARKCYGAFPVNEPEPESEEPVKEPAE